MVRDTPPSQDLFTHQICDSYLKEYRRYAPETLILQTRSDIKAGQKWYVTLRHPEMHLHTKFGIPTSKNIGYAPD